MSPHASLEARLPRPPGVLRRALAAHPLALDVTIVVFYFLGCALFGTVDVFSGSTAGAAGPYDAPPGTPSYLTWPLLLVTILRFLMVAAALLFRRRIPLLGLIAVLLASTGDLSVQGVPNAVALCFLLYAVPVYRSVPAGWFGYAFAVIASGAQLFIPGVADSLVFDTETGGGSTEPATLSTFFGPFLVSAIWMLAILMLGINIGNRRRYLEAIIGRAHQLARERDQLAQLAVAEERSRIAREMHDIVAHSVSVMIALSEGAARAATVAPEAAADAMQRSAETGRTALAEMRRLLGALHSPDETSIDLVPQPGVKDLETLVRGFTDAGLQVSLRVEGEAAGDRGQELAVYRIAQEGLTNVLRYAGTGACAEVTVALLQDLTVVEVRDHGRTPGDTATVSGVGSGRGLAGLAERVRMFGGSIESGPVPAHEGSGWRVRAVLPVNADARETGRLARNTIPTNIYEGQPDD